MSASAPTAHAERPFATRALLALVFAVVAFIAIWQGFGLAGFGTDLHWHRAGWALWQLFFTGVLLGLRGWLVVRALVVLAFFGSACVAWWTVRSTPDHKSLSLRDAVHARDWYKERLAVPTAEEAVNSDGLRGIHQLVEQYPSLCKELPAEHDRWAGAVADDIAARYQKLPPDDFKSAATLNKLAKALAAAHPASAAKLDAARAGWRAEALRARVGALGALPPGNWEAFSRTAFGRRALAEALPDTRDALVRAENDWAARSVAALGPHAEDLKRAHWEVLALKSLDPSDGRFGAARKVLFEAAHGAAQARAQAHAASGRGDLARGVARAHVADWAACADALGAGERGVLAEFRATYEALGARPVAVPPEVAPPPRRRP